MTTSDPYVPELVADDVADYVAKAVELANDIPRLTALRSGLRDQMANSLLYDGGKFARDFSSAMRDMWQEWRNHQDAGARRSVPKIVGREMGRAITKALQSAH